MQHERISFEITLYLQVKNCQRIQNKARKKEVTEKCREIPWTIGQLVFFVDVIRIYLEIQLKMTSCHPGFIPKLLGCASDINDDEHQCQEVSLSCALLSLIVALAIPTTLGLVLESGTREPVTRTGIVCFVKNRNRKFENSPYPETNRNRLNTRRVPEGS